MSVCLGVFVSFCLWEVIWCVCERVFGVVKGLSIVSRTAIGSFVFADKGGFEATEIFGRF